MEGLGFGGATPDGVQAILSSMLVTPDGVQGIIFGTSNPNRFWPHAKQIF